ncbi:phosphoesterase [Leucobacter weissii]|uniref:Phosphoesterase n=1 Tax=Leucobacter weissii TaxID=1983706 RepID=A0A939S8X9_9MICO|nr:phosphatase PAP2 family protein [Leucobacter weissii]MBO1902576.1 phosphoesterase [Leucobacter weissii]
MSERSSGRGRAVLCALLALAAGWGSYALGVGSVLGQRAEASVLDAAEFTYDPPAPLGLVSIPAVLIALVALGALAWAARGFARAFTILCVSVATIVASQLLKQRVLVRPDLFEFDAVNTFPSGHMAVFAALGGALIWAVPARLKGVTAIGAATLMGVVAWQLLHYGWHRPSDVIGALALALLAFSLAAALRPRGRGGSRDPGSGTMAANRVIGAALGVTGVVLVLGGLVLSLVAANLGSDSLLLAAGEVALVGTAALTATVFSALAR